MTEILHLASENDVFTYVFLGLSIILAGIWHNFLIVFVHKSRELVLSHDWRSFEAENANSGSRLRFSLVLIHLVVLSLFIYQITAYVNGEASSFWKIVLTLFCIHTFRLLMTKLLEFVFSRKGMYEIWVESYAWIHYILGVLFFPLLVLMTYSPDLTFSFSAHFALFLFILAESLLFYRLFIVFYNGIVSLFYLFLYLCTLEILPLFIAFNILL